MDALNTLRAILVAFSAIAALLLAFRGQWVPFAVMAAGIAAHFALWGYLWAERQRTATQIAALEGIPAAER